MRISLIKLIFILACCRETRERSRCISGNGISLSVLADLSPLQFPCGNVSRISMSCTRRCNTGIQVCHGCVTVHDCNTCCQLVF